VQEDAGMIESNLAEPQKFNRSVSLLAWGLNEELLLIGFLDKAFGMLEAAVTDYEVVFVNDGSTDQTAEILTAYQAREPRLKIVNNPENVNVGISCRRAVQAASKEYLFWQTVDWSYDLTELRIYIELLNDFDVVQGIRPVPERLLSYVPVLRSIYRVQRRSDSITKAVISLSNYYVLRILFGVHFHDFQNVTFYPTRLAQSLPLQATTPFVNPEMLIRAYYGGARIIEVPINFIPRTQGEAKGTRLPILVRTVLDILRNWVSWGWRLRLSQHGSSRGSISRVARPLRLPESVARTVVPLFKKFH
jgi:glycosyltransferase involved in cell wall biosynthesis